MTWSLDNLRSILGIGIVIAVAWALSDVKKRVPWRIVAIGLGLEIAIAVTMFALPPVRVMLAAASDAIDALMVASTKGAQFVFGHLAGGPAPFAVTDPSSQTVLAFGALQLIIVISALSAMLWRWGVLELACKGLGFVLKRTMGLNGPLALSTAANIFLGMVESPLVVRPYLEKMSRSDLFVIMTTGLATIAGTVMALYATFLKSTQPDAAGHILVASFMAAPGSIVIARIMTPQVEGEADQPEQESPRLYRSTMDAFARGVQDGVNLLIDAAGGSGARRAGRHDPRPAARNWRRPSHYRPHLRLDLRALHVADRHTVGRRAARRRADGREDRAQRVPRLSRPFQSADWRD
jgi:CNT family concentrative nucleoside transporter